MIHDLKMQKIQNCEHIPVPGDSDKWGPIVYMKAWKPHTYMRKFKTHNQLVYGVMYKSSSKA